MLRGGEKGKEKSENKNTREQEKTRRTNFTRSKGKEDASPFDSPIGIPPMEEKRKKGYAQIAQEKKNRTKTRSLFIDSSRRKERESKTGNKGERVGT